MNRIQFWILTLSVIVVGQFFLFEIYLSRMVHEDNRKVVLLERLAREGDTYSNRWQQLAARVYQLSQQDPMLRDILTRQQITVTPKVPINAAAANEPSPQSTGTAPPGRSSP